MGETRKLAAILVSDVVGFSRLAGADADRIGVSGCSGIKET
jgi:adenylate cyclase